MEKIAINLVGIDASVLTNICVKYIECEKVNLYKKGYVVEGTEILTAADQSFKYIHIEDYAKFGILDIRKSPYNNSINSRLELFGRQTEIGNINPMLAETYIDYVNFIIEYIGNKYGVWIAQESLRIKKIEIANNLLLDESYSMYRRIFCVTLNAFGKRMSWEAEYKDKKSGGETMSIANNSTKIKIYDKFAESAIAYSDKTVVRLEITLLTAKRVRSGFGDDWLKNLTDIKIKEVYDKHVKQICKYCEDQKKISDKQLMDILYEYKKVYAPSQWIGKTLQRLLNDEITTGIPQLLDVDDLLPLIRRLDLHRKGCMYACQN